MAKLGEVCLINPKSCTLRDDTEVSFIPMTKVGEHGEFDASEIKNYSEVKKGFTNFQNGDILFAKITPCMENGKGAIAHNMKNGIGFGSTEFHVLRPDTDKITSEWLYYLTTWKTFRKEAERNMTGSAGQKRVPKTFLENYVVNLPDIDTQKSENKILRKVDDLIFLRKQQLAKLDELVKARFVEKFGSYPENENAYPVVNVSDIADAGVGVVIKPTQYYVTEERGIKAFRSLNIGEMYIKDSDWVYFSTEGNESNKKSQLHENDLLIVRSGAPGTSCVVTKEFEGCNAVDVIIAHPNLSKVNPWYLCAYINYPHGKKQIEEGTGGAAQQHFNVGKCNNLKVLLPPLEAQNQFAAFVERVNQQKQTVRQSLEKLELLKKALMQEYFG